MGIVRFALKFPYTFYVLAALILFLGVIRPCRRQPGAVVSGQTTRVPFANQPADAGHQADLSLQTDPRMQAQDREARPDRYARHDFRLGQRPGPAQRNGLALSQRPCEAQAAASQQIRREM
jgi:hypothetical protein